MFSDVKTKLVKKNKILFSKDSKCLKELIELMKKQDHRTLVLWAFDCVETPLTMFEIKYPNEDRPRIAYDYCQRWAKGEVKMPVAKNAIIRCHSVAKDIEDECYIALVHAIAQGLSTVHIGTHALGLPIYELTAIVRNNPTGFEVEVNRKIQQYIDKLIYYEKHRDNIVRKWASFLSNDK